MRKLTEQEFLERLRDMPIPSESFSIVRAKQVLLYTIVDKAIKKYKYKRTAAKKLGISRIRLYKMMKLRPRYTLDEVDD